LPRNAARLEKNVWSMCGAEQLTPDAGAPSGPGRFPSPSGRASGSRYAFHFFGLDAQSLLRLRFDRPVDGF